MGRSALHLKHLVRRGAGTKLATGAVATATALAVGIASIASAQQLGGKTVSLTVGQSFEYSDNIDLVTDPVGDVFRSRTSLDFAFDSVTSTQDFKLNLGGAFEIDDDGRTEFADPYARLRYVLEGANSRLSLSGRYAEIDLDDAFSTVFTEGSVEDGLVIPPVSEIARIEGGVRTEEDYVLGFQTGLRGPIGLRLNLSERNRGYSDTLDPGLNDTRRHRASGEMTFRINPQITARLIASYYRFQEDTLLSEVDRRETSYGVGVRYDISPVLTLDASLRQEKIERRGLIGTFETEGPAYGLDLTRLLPNGAIVVDFSSEPTLNGRQSTLRATRAMTLRRDGALSYGIGVTQTEGLSSEPLFNLSYSQPLKRSRFSLTFSQEARTDEERLEEAVILTRLSANYAMPLTENLRLSMTAGINDVNARQDRGEDRFGVSFSTNLIGQINNVASWSAGINYTDTDTASGILSRVDRTEQRLGLQLAYRHNLAQEWDVVARYEYTEITDTFVDDRRSNGISIGIEKKFSFRP